MRIKLPKEPDNTSLKSYLESKPIDATKLHWARLKIKLFCDDCFDSSWFRTAENEENINTRDD